MQNNLTSIDTRCYNTAVTHQILIENGIIWTFIQQAIFWSNLLGCVLTWISFRYQKRIPLLLLFTSCFADTMVAICTYSLSVASYWLKRWVFGEFGCYYYALSRYFFQNFSFHVIVTSSIERLISFVWPFLYDKHFALGFVNKVLFAITLYTGIVSLLPVFGPHSIKLRYPCTYCNFEWGSPDNQAFAWVTIVNNLFGIILSISCNCIVIMALYKMTMKRRESRQMAKRKGKRQMSDEKEMTCILLLTSLAFCVSWLPHTIFISLRLFDSQNMLLGQGIHILELWTSRIVYANSILSPYIYIFGRRRIRLKLCKWATHEKVAKLNFPQSVSATRIDLS
ncbi:uncharacterized protein TRIADDRAFT_54207 [Trichoplax adhaerens]|uniref:G-protein coupled receptors family 1 profile domain-containing protein n=1 Tax=Trichoplax adhaerens TaxID=10228 RepID=B3RRE5_TRIAD|nr:hypothetical protein TRIADDRAFT_54207 [Trichoplax adhaerens]EDV26862.1 hypothetical protein TRIADDRAFT_54207 [Trichoplax adhaerens]|eukprot:XP_002110858.1 hypothetical protein TRIADDRAFT_54207 [Trichoplax adhaerens]